MLVDYLCQVNVTLTYRPILQLRTMGITSPRTGGSGGDRWNKPYRLAPPSDRQWEGDCPVTEGWGGEMNHGLP